MKSLTVYIQNQAGSLAEYLIQELVLSLAGWIPSLPGIVLRNLLYRFIMRLDGVVAIENGARLRFTRNIHLHKGVYVDCGVYLHATPGGIEVDEKTFLMHHAELHVYNFRNLPGAGIKIGKQCIIGEFSVIRGQGGVRIGDSVLFGPLVQVLAVQHRYGDTSRPVMEQGITARGIQVGDGAWLGAGCIVLDGVSIGKGAIIGAGAVVTGDIPDHCIAVGSPARVIRNLVTQPLEQSKLAELELGIPAIFMASKSKV
ncbi:MAG: acyltransferase [Chloroflexi bacterium]|nr:acyltransferase [Chloroflexota bacterium]OJW03407.1 MAG: transferase [Chloroflexi bacterium 54-19]